MAKQDDFIRYTIRVPKRLYEQLQAAAGMKSVNAEIVARLDRSFDDESLAIKAMLDNAELKTRIEELEASNQQLSDLIAAQSPDDMTFVVLDLINDRLDRKEAKALMRAALTEALTGIVSPKK